MAWECDRGDQGCSSRRNIGLKEAKDLVDAYLASQPVLKKKMDQVLATAQQRFIRWLIGFLILAAGVAYLVIHGL